MKNLTINSKFTKENYTDAFSDSYINRYIVNVSVLLETHSGLTVTENYDIMVGYTQSQNGIEKLTAQNGTREIEPMLEEEIFEICLNEINLEKAVQKEVLSQYTSDEIKKATIL